MTRRRPPLLALPALLLLIVQTATADELLMRNGDHLTGTVVSRSGDTVKFKTRYAGTLSITWSEIAKISTDQPITVGINDDHVIQTSTITNRETELVIEDEVTREEMVLEQAALTAINPEPWTLGQGYKFTGIINFSSKTERGNNDSDEIDADGEATYRRKQHRARGMFTFEKDNKNGESTKNKWKFRTAYDYFPATHWNWGLKIPKWYYGTTVVGEKDQFADLTLRIGAGPHVGYQFYEGHSMNLLTEIGLLRVMEQFKNIPDQKFWASGWLIDFDVFLLKIGREHV